MREEFGETFLHCVSHFCTFLNPLHLAVWHSSLGWSKGRSFFCFFPFFFFFFFCNGLKNVSEKNLESAWEKLSKYGLKGALGPILVTRCVELVFNQRNLFFEFAFVGFRLTQKEAGLCPSQLTNKPNSFIFFLCSVLPHDRLIQPACQ